MNLNALTLPQELFRPLRSTSPATLHTAGEPANTRIWPYRSSLAKGRPSLPCPTGFTL
jgi:hypothetical protein